ncbi:MAG: permease-like cell division protein FtsX [Acidimicrobiia bacterium]|nr:permease-like cell division protein FtsX [Acidimicrobiia bacterium]NNC76149.1 hypothetical protein [Acidimicrobiia bacterium]
MRIQYALREALRNIARNPLVVLGAILAVLLSLGLTFSTFVFGEVVKKNTQRWADDVRVIAYVSDDLNADQTATLLGTVFNWDEVESAFFFSKTEAQSEALDLFADQPALLRIYTENPNIAPASIRVQPGDPEDYQSIVTRLRGSPGVIEVASAGPGIDAMISLRDGLSWVALAAAIGAGAAAVLLIANTIHMAIFARREEIGIMKLVGAGNWFVRTPFLVEGMIEGLVGAGLAVVSVIGVHRLMLTRLSALPEWINIEIANEFFIGRSVFVLIAGVIAGFLGSGLAVSRYLRA